jgi:lycopene cyclase domain-containing protein
MTYFGFLGFFLVIPILVFAAIAWWDGRRGLSRPDFRNGRAVGAAIGLHMLAAVIYTMPWDNYLVASGVWSYDPALVTGRLIGYVPVEEYSFFILETLLAGLVWCAVARRSGTPAPLKASPALRIWPVLAVGAVWAGAVVLLLRGYAPATYLALTLVWALPPIGLQLGFGGDILWRHRRLVALTVLPLTLYLSLADSLAIASGTWTIAPGTSTRLFIGALPVEEAVFFLLTNLLIASGMTLFLAKASRARLAQVWQRYIEKKALPAGKLQRW